MTSTEIQTYVNINLGIGIYAYNTHAKFITLTRELEVMFIREREFQVLFT